jgi:hypothetical protein
LQNAPRFSLRQGRLRWKLGATGKEKKGKEEEKETTRFWEKI